MPGTCRTAALLFLLALLGLAPPSARPGSSSQAKSCLDAARKALGPRAEVLKCGDLTGNSAVETVAAIRIKRFPATEAGIPVSKLAVLRRAHGGWISELAVDNDSMRNSVGYIENGLRRLPGPPSIGYRVSFSKHSEDAPGAGFTVWLCFLHSSGENEGLPLEITWNPAVKRFQRFSYEDMQHAFQPEVKNP